MTLAGTRPILQDELLKYELHHRARIAIKPGITGMWQVRKDDEKQYYTEIKRIIKSKNLVERVQKIVDENYHLHRRHSFVEFFCA